jgi:transposase
MRHELSDYEWTAIKPMLPNKPRGVRRVNDRRVLNGIFWVLRSGAPWRDLPETYGPLSLVAIASFVGGGLVSGTRSWMRWLLVMMRRCR